MRMPSARLVMRMPSAPVVRRGCLPRGCPRADDVGEHLAPDPALAPPPSKPMPRASTLLDPAGIPEQALVLAPGLLLVSSPEAIG